MRPHRPHRTRPVGSARSQTTFGGPGFRTHTLSFWIYQQGLRYFNISYAAATSWLLLLACLVIAAALLAWRRRAMAWIA